MKICLVTPDIVGPIRNGGIGTHAYNLCQLLKGHELTVLFTSSVEDSAPANWKDHYREQGIRILTHTELKNRDRFQKIAKWEDWFFERSRRIAEFLQVEQFDLVHFQDWHANGFFSIRQRKTGVALQDTRIAVTMHSPNAWSREGMQEWPSHVLLEMKQDYAERYCCENADILIAPSQHMFDWAESHGWTLPGDHRVLYCAYTNAPECDREGKIDRTHVIFFGRLETRKGLGLFIDGLKLFKTRNPGHGIKKITFLGKPGQHNGRRAEVILDEVEAANPEIEIVREYTRDTHGAMEYLRKSGGVVFMPSLLDNCPYTVIECIERGIPFRVARTGGIPELANERCLFDDCREGVADALAELERFDHSISHRYSARSANAAWQDLHANTAPVHSNDDGIRPKVSICIPYYNLPVFLPQLLESIEAMPYPDYEVIVCNDGSPMPEANEVFEQMRARYGARGWKFVEQENGGVGLARNAAASHATGEYMVFMDADNLARPEMLETMVRAMRCSGADALTCYFVAFATDIPPKGDADADYLYRPIGATLPLGIIENTFGDANCIMKRKVFEAVGGFGAERTTSFEDWELLLQLSYHGYKVDVIPQEIFWYRHLQDGFSRVTNHHRNHMRAVRKILDDTPPAQRELMEQFTLPIYYQYLELERKIGRERITRLSDKTVPWHKHIYRWYRRMRKDPKYIKRI